MLKHIKILFMLLLFISKAIYASGNDSLQKAIALNVAPLFDEARTGLLPINYVRKGDTCTVVGVQVDTSGVPWFHVTLKTKKYWSPVKYWQYVSEIDNTTFPNGTGSIGRGYDAIREEIVDSLSSVAINTVRDQLEVG